MVIRGKPRGGGGQLADYLMKKADNDNVRVFEIRGTSQPDNLKASLLEMSLTAELTRSDKGLYHAQINPAYGEDKKMQAADWFKAADLLEQELCLQGQKRVIVLHEKKDRLHAHVVWERFNHEKGTMISDSFSRLAQDRARKAMEAALEHKKTPNRNPHRPDMKQVLSDVWQKTLSGTDFVKESFLKGYTIVKGQLRRPYMVVDEKGRSFDLARQLQGIKTREVTERLKKEKLPTEKEAIQAIRDKQKETVHEQPDIQRREQSDSIKLQRPGHWVDQYDKQQQQRIHEHRETIKERMIREMKEQIEAQRRLNKGLER